ncbi:Cell wall endopeptidase, family M23/M37 [plant metagenome]|uniref:Cell wall endopeptidase, family M23/M37 n=1 Tax=plant metagenome TaxID=1297885 RepID=A0A484UIV5_9ZZZZ
MTKARAAASAAAGFTLALLAVATPPGLAQEGVSADMAARQSEAETRQAELRDRIDALQKDIDARESARKEAADALRESETAISRINRRLDELATQRKQAGGELERLEDAIVAQNKELGVRREELAAQLRTQYASGLSPWTAMLSGDDPQEIGRNLGYLDYVSRARADALARLQRELQRLSDLQQAADARRAEIQKVETDTGAQKDALVAQQRTRATLLAKLDGQLSAQRSEANRLDRDNQRLSRVIGDLEKQIEAARKAAEAARKAEAARRAEAARKAAAAAEAARKAEAERRAQAERDARREAAARAEAARRADEATRARMAAEDAARAREAAQAAARAKAMEPSAEERVSAVKEPIRGSAQATLPPAGGFKGLKSGLTPPVPGQVMARFGSSRPEGGVWRGVLLKAAEGAPVKAVAAGTVVYADWLRGFGNLLIVDHGEQYLTVYAYNQSLLRRVGDVVRAGEAVAAAGSTGGQVDSGLYFEVRHRGAPVDPYQFISR